MSEQSEFYNKEFNKHILSLEKQGDKYKQALDKIYKVANNRVVFCEHCSGDDDFSCEDCEYCKILNIINKAKRH